MTDDNRHRGNDGEQTVIRREIEPPPMRLIVTFGTITGLISSVAIAVAVGLATASFKSEVKDLELRLSKEMAIKNDVVSMNVYNAQQAAQDARMSKIEMAVQTNLSAIARLQQENEDLRVQMARGWVGPRPAK